LPGLLFAALQPSNKYLFQTQKKDKITGIKNAELKKTTSLFLAGQEDDNQNF
jgi:hypothetical protein